MQVAGVEHGDAPSEVDETSTFHVGELCVAGRLDEEFMGLSHPTGHGSVAAGEQGGVGGGEVL